MASLSLYVLKSTDMECLMADHQCIYRFSGSVKETLIKSLSDFTLEFLYMTRNSLTRIASYLRKARTKSCIKIFVESDSAI